MASANPAVPLNGGALPPLPSFWRRESNALKQGIKTGIAGLITYAIYAKWHLPESYWAVFTALVVTQANLGASWKAALYRTIGSTVGALSAALLIPFIGMGPLRVGLALFLLASLFAYLTVLHPTFATAGFAVAIVLVFSGHEQAWHVAWNRALYTALGSLVAFLVGALVWPVRARQGLRTKLAGIIDGCANLYGAVTRAAIQGTADPQELQQIGRQLHQLRGGITQQMDEARNELVFLHRSQRFDEEAYQALVDLTDQVRRRLSAMAEDSELYLHARVHPSLLPSLPALAEQTAANFSVLADALRHPGKQIDSLQMEAAIANLDADVARLREQRATAPFDLDRMLPFWSFLFNMREIAQDLKQLEWVLGKVG